MGMQKEIDVSKTLPNKPSKRLDLKNWRSQILVTAIIAIVGVSAAVPFFFSRYEETLGGPPVRRLIATHDLWMHLHTMEQFDNALRSGVIYPRWVADINHGYGILTLIYYPPGFYYLTSTIHAVFSDWLNALFVLTALALVGSGLALYFLARTFYGVLASTVAAVLYIMLPIHMLDLYWRGGLPSVIGYIFPPLVVYFAYRLGRDGKPHHYAGFALFYSLHLLIHLPVSLMFSYAMAFYAVVWAVKERDWRIGARLGAAMTLGLLLSAVYWLPAALETKYAYEFATDLFPYHQSYITLAPVDDEKPYYDLWRLLNNVFLFNSFALISTILVLRRVRRREEQADGASIGQWSPLGMWITMGIATMFMSTSFSVYISKMLPKIQITVPAWRWLALAGMFTSLLVAAAIHKIRNQSAMPPILLWTCRAAIVVVILLNVWLSIRWAVIRPLTHPTYVHPATSTVVESSWTPKNATHPQELPDTRQVVVEPEAAAVEISRWDPQDREIQVRVEKDSIVRLKTYNFPGWTARVDGKIVPMLSDKDGVQQIEVPPGIHTVRATFENTGPRTSGTALSALGGLLILGLAFAGRLRARTADKETEHTELAAESLIDQVRNLDNSVSSARVTGISGLKRAVAIVIVLVVGTAIILMTTWRSDSTDAGRSVRAPASTPSQQSGGGGRLDVGSDAQLYIAGRDSVMVAVDEKASEEMISALSKRDQPAVDALIESGRALKTDNNTRVRVLQTATGKTKIRILEGPHVMAEGWVLERWLK